MRIRTKMKMYSCVFGVNLMKSTNIFLEIVRYTHSIIFSDRFIRKATKRPMDFTRNRKMSFTDYIFAIIKGTKSSLQASIYTFFESMKKEDMEYSKQAFSKGRQRIKPEAFRDLFQGTVDKFYEKADSTTWRNHHLLGIDGTRINLPCTETLKEIYGGQATTGTPQVQALASCLYDLLNGMIVDVRIGGCKSSEQDAAKNIIECFDEQKIKNPLFIMDRGYPSAVLIDTLIRKNYKFVLRCSSEFFKKMKSSNPDKIIDYQFQKLKYPLKVRVIQLQLSPQNTEYLITNLFDSDLSVNDFSDLYHMRWGIETKYDDIKNKLEIENFTGSSPDAILQDFYATLFLANLAGALEFDLRDEIEAAHSKPVNKYKYRMNTNMTISELKRTVIKMLITGSNLKRLKLFGRMKRRLMKAVVPVRPNKVYPRIKRHIAAKFSQNSKRP